MSIGTICKGFGQIRNLNNEKKIEPFSVDFAYTGDVQEYVVPYTGLYKLEVWGGQGGSGTLWNGVGTNGGTGGYTQGYAKLRKNTILYIVNGGRGTSVSGRGGSYSFSGGYNGGGATSGSTEDNTSGCGSGGGATHIALVSGTLASIGQENFNNNGLIVAAGGGGSYTTVSYPPPDYRGSYSNYYGGSGNISLTSGSFGSGGARSGGGYYGGTNRTGGSGWTGGVPEITYKGVTYIPSITQGGNSGNGKAKISFITN